MEATENAPLFAKLEKGEKMEAKMEGKTAEKSEMKAEGKSEKAEGAKGEKAEAEEAEVPESNLSGIGIGELMIFTGFLGVFLFMFFNNLAKRPIIPENDPYLKENERLEVIYS